MRTFGVLSIALLMGPVSSPVGAAESAVVFERDIRPLLARYCHQCHGEAKPQGDLILTRFTDEAGLLVHRSTWKRALDVLAAREMPPESAPQPTPAEREKLTTWLAELIRRPDPSGVRNPGHVVLRRLNQVEYNNTMYDLFRIFKQPTYFNPSQGKLPESIRLVMHRNQRPTLVTLPTDDVGYGYDNIGEVLSLPPFLMEKYVTAAREVVDGAFEQKSRALGRGSDARDRAATRSILASFLPRAFRHPVSEERIDRYLTVYDAAADNDAQYETGLKAALSAALVSPDFLFRIEEGTEPTDASGIVPLTDYELASRLSYFLWSSMPDDELFSLAAQGKLRDPAVLEAQARRMLRSPKVKELAENFAIQWLQLANVVGAMPDPDRFPNYYRQKYIGESFRQEALLLFEAVMIEDRSVLDLVDARFTYLNETMARYYGLEPKQTGKGASLFWERYDLTDRRRGGVMTLGGVLVATSSSARTSPVKRGKWILETILGAPPPPPLPNVPDLDNAPVAADTLSLRDKLEAHRADPNCASCHRRMDPLGFGFENFDAVGLWRERDGDKQVDPRGSLVDGSSFNGVVELKDLVLEKRRDDFLRCLTEHLLTFALGRKLEYYDAAAVDEITAELPRNDYRFSELVAGVARSYPFRYVQRPSEKTP